MRGGKQGRSRPYTSEGKQSRSRGLLHRKEQDGRSPLAWR
jgi:hypothetical protein